MAIKINGATVITNSRRGVFRTVNPGSYSTANRPPGASEGDVIYDTDEKTIFVWNGTEWVAAGGGAEGSLIAPTIPPFSGYTTQEVDLSDPDGKVQFSLDGVNFSSTLNVPIDTFYYVGFTSDILSAPHNSQYELDIVAEFPEINQSINPTIKFKVDKLPDPFSFFTETDVAGNFTTEVPPFSPLDSINAPTSIWAASDAASCEIRVAESGWFTAPTAPDTYYVNRGEVVQMRHTTGGEATTTYTSTLYIGYGTNAGEYESGTLTSTTRSLSYDPQPLTLNTGDEISTEGSTFSLPVATGVNVDPVGADWEVATDASFTNIVDSSYDDTVNTNSWQSTVSLTQGNTYYARARYIDSSGAKSEWNEKNNLLCDQYFYYKVAVRISGGAGGKAGWAGQNLGGGRQGGTGTVELVSSTPSKTTPSGTVSSSNGASASNTTGGGGYLGSNGGNGRQRNDYWSAGGGGGGGFSINSVFIAGVGGSGGNGPRDISQGVMLGGQGASLPAADGGRGNWGDSGPLAGYGGTVDTANVNDPLASPTPGVGEDSRYNNANNEPNNSNGAGAGGWGAGESGFTGVGTAGRNQGGGGGASWNRPVGFVVDSEWRVTSVTSAYNSTAQQLYTSNLLDTNTFTSIGTKSHGTRDISAISS